MRLGEASEYLLKVHIVPSKYDRFTAAGRGNQDRELRGD